MPKGIKITDDQKNWNKLKNTLDILQRKNSNVYVGILEEDMNKPKLQLDDSTSAATLGEVAIYNEFGTSDIPARSFIREPFDSTNGYEKLRNSLVKRVIDGVLTIDAALNILGSSIAKSFIKRIKDGINPPNDEETKDQKLSETPLIATGQLIEHITYKIEK